MFLVCQQTHVLERRRQIMLPFNTIYNYSTGEVPGQMYMCVCMYAFLSVQICLQR